MAFSNGVSTAVPSTKLPLRQELSRNRAGQHLETADPKFTTVLPSFGKFLLATSNLLLVTSSHYIGGLAADTSHQGFKKGERVIPPFSCRQWQIILAYLLMRIQNSAIFMVCGERTQKRACIYPQFLWDPHSLSILQQQVTVLGPLFKMYTLYC